MRYENLQADFDRALAHLGLEAIPIPQINRTTERDHSDYRPFYTSRARRIIENVYRDTLDHFGYAF